VIVGFDLDGTLEKPGMAQLLKTLLAAGHEVHIMSGVFLESGPWQDQTAKRMKLVRLQIPIMEPFDLQLAREQRRALLHIVEAVSNKEFDRDYRLADIGLRKGALCFKYGVEIFFDDSALYCEMIPKMSGGTTVIHVR